jgi:hypothetical protein
MNALSRNVYFALSDSAEHLWDTKKIDGEINDAHRLSLNHHQE